jgi:ABC-type sugar transport system substrate-binding protein
MKRTMLAGLVGVSLVLGACGQAKSSTGSTSSAATTKKVSTIGISNLGLSFPFPASISKGIKDEAAAKGVKIIELDAQGKADKQTSDIQDLIGQKPEGVLLLPVDGGVATGLVDQLKTANIPTVAVASQVGDPKTRKPEDVYPGLVALVTQQEVAAGASAGELALKALPGGGKIAIVEGAAGFAENTTRVQDFSKAADAAGVKFTVVAHQPGDWVPDKAQSACQNMLASNPDIKLFYALSDDMAVGCAKAVKSAGKSAVVIGIGGSKLGIDAINSGEIQGTVCYKPADMGKLAFDTLYDYLTTGKAPGSKFVTYATPGISKANVSDCTPQW